jgi:outer membrane biosynthesis protein TonB
MADSVVISNIKENILEFDAEVRGIKDPKMSVNFVIKTDLVNLSFQAKRVSGNTWSVVVPPLKMLEVGDTHPYMITVDVEGYHFEPMTGEVQIVSEIKPRVSKPSVKKEEKKVEAKPEEKKTDTKPAVPEEEEKKVEDKAEEKDEAPEEKKVEETTTPSPYDETIQKIITRETLRKSPSDVAVRKVLGEVKKAASTPAPVIVPVETPEQIALRTAEEARLAEQAAREEAVRNILKGMSGTKASIRH